MSAVDIGAQEFIDAVWKGGAIYIDEEETFKRALGGETYRSWWLLKPSVLSKMMGFARSFGTGSADITDKKTQMLGGTMVIKGGKVVYTHKETSTFDNGSAQDLLAAVKGEGTCAPAMDSTPSQATAVECDVKCSR